MESHVQDVFPQEVLDICSCQVNSLVVQYISSSYGVVLLKKSIWGYQRQSSLYDTAHHWDLCSYRGEGNVPPPCIFPGRNLWNTAEDLCHRADLQEGSFGLLSPALHQSYLASLPAGHTDVSLFLSQSVIQSVSQSVSQPVIQSVSQSVSQSFSQSVSHSVIQSVSQSFSQSVSHLAMASYQTPARSPLRPFVCRSTYPSIKV